MVPSAVIGKSSGKWFVIVIAALVASVMVPAAGFAYGPCADDVAKFCKDVQPGGGRIVKCMKEHEKDLTPACKQHIADVKQQGKEFRAACEDDVLRFCKDVKPGGGRMFNCLKEHANELSPDCRTRMESRKGQK